jgi:hypothetical protein
VASGSTVGGAEDDVVLVDVRVVLDVDEVLDDEVSLLAVDEPPPDGRTASQMTNPTIAAAAIAPMLTAIHFPRLAACGEAGCHDGIDGWLGGE